MKQLWLWLAKNIIPLLAVSWFVFLATWIVVKGSNLGDASTANAATIAVSERLVQMAQWTVTTVLTLGGALIGLNWYQNERRYQEDKASFEQKITARVDQLGEKVRFLEFVSTAQVQMSVFQAVSQRAGDPESPDFVPNCVEGYRLANELPIRSAYAQVLRQYAIAASENSPGHYTRQGLPLLQEFTVELRKEFPEIAAEISFSITMTQARDRGEEVDRRG